MSVPIEGSYGVRGIVVTSRVFGKDIAAIGIGERECVLVQGGQHVPTNPRSEGHSGLRSRISAYFVVYGQINVYGVTTKSERHKRSYWTRTADGNGIGGRKAPVPYGS